MATPARVPDRSAGASVRTGGQTYYLFPDHLGGTHITASGTNGAELGKLLYKPWGETRVSTGTTLTTWRFTGQREDATIGLYYYGARYYDSQLGRFAQPDTIVPNPGDPQALNRYSYTLNNPVRYTDPSGHLTEEELQTLLGSDYDTLMSLWSQYDQYWVAILEAIQGGGNLQASLLGSIELHFEGSGKDIRTNVYNGSYSKQLQDWQGKGAYRVQNPGMTSADADRFRDQLFNISENTGIPNAVVVPVFDYQRRVNGRMQPTYLGVRLIGQQLGDWQWSSVSAAVANGLGLPEFIGQASNLAVPTAIKTVLGLSTPGSVFVGALNVAIGSVIATYQAPKHYTNGWPGVMDINSMIDPSLLWP